MEVIPKDCSQRKICSRANAILHYKIDSEHWEYRLETGNDVGRDCTIELTEDNEWRNNKIEGQVKGQTNPNLILKGEYISFPMDLKTINYALNSRYAFVLFVVDITNEIVYYQAIQEYFISCPSRYEKKNEDQKTINIRIQVSNMISESDSELQNLARRTYIQNETNIPTSIMIKR